MANYRVNETILSNLSDEDVSFMFAIYRHRCLDENLAYRFFYSKQNIRRQYTTQRIAALETFKYIEEIDYDKEYPALFLTTNGLQAVKWLAEKYDKEAELCKGRYEWLQSRDLKMSRVSLNHQMHLNKFALEFEQYAKENTEYTYYDGKFMPPASNFMMPDAMIDLPDCYLFLEMDMNTETSQSLIKKWESYRVFLNDPAEFYSEKPIVMLFIMENVSRLDMRRNTIMKSIVTYIIDRVDGRFECYVGSSEELHSRIKSHILGWSTPERAIEDASCRALQNNFGFSISTPSFLKGLDTSFDLYIRRLTPEKKIEVFNKRPQEFLVDIWLDHRSSVVRTILNYRKLSSQITQVTKRQMAYLIIVPSETWIYKKLKQMDVSQPDNIYFTTPSRLSACNWEEAIFIIDIIGNLAHFTDKSLNGYVHEKKL